MWQLNDDSGLIFNHKKSKTLETEPGVCMDWKEKICMSVYPLLYLWKGNTPINQTCPRHI